MAKILLQAFNQGGLSDSKYSGIKNSFARMIGFDIHSKPGLLQVNQRMTKISGSTIDEFCKVVVDCSNGIRYWFSSTSGKIWQEKNGTFTLVFTTTYTTGGTIGGVACLGAAEYQGYIYWATQDRLHRIPVDSADGAAAWTANAKVKWAFLDEFAGSAALAGDDYAIPTSISHSATHLKTFVATNVPLKGIIVQISDTFTSGDWTITVHEGESSGTLVGSKTISYADLFNYADNLPATADSYPNLEFIFTTPLKLIEGNTYHFHLTTTVAGGTVYSDTINDFSTVYYKLLTNSDSEYHPMKETNLVLYIGDRHFVHQVDNSTFSNQALDLPINYRVTALGKMRTDLLIGTIIASNVARCDIFRWNTYGESFISQDTVYETGINCFLESDNYTIISAGKIGNLYSYNGDQMTFYKKIPGEYSPTKQCIIYPNATALFGFLPVFGVSNVQGDPCDQGVYSLGKHSNNYTNVLNLEFPISQVDASDYNRVTGVKIGAIVASGNDLYISWEYNSTYGVDKLDYTLKVKKPILETRMMSPQAGKFTTFNEYIITYETLPSGTSIVLKQDKDSEGFGSAMNLLNDTSRKQMIAEAERGDARTQQLRLEAVTNSNDAPKIQEIVVDVT